MIQLSRSTGNRQLTESLGFPVRSVLESYSQCLKHSKPAMGTTSRLWVDLGLVSRWIAGESRPDLKNKWLTENGT
jgi:hypothetical protein